MDKRAGAVTMKGAPLTLLGPELKPGDKAPDFITANNDLGPAKLSDYAGKVVILSAVPSLDTPVCDLETRRFNSEASALSPEIVILTVSMDLPFAQKRWCGSNGVERVITLSDYKDASFGQAYGVLIEELRLLARAVFVIDKEGFVRYTELVKEIGSEPDYEAALSAASELA